MYYDRLTKFTIADNIPLQETIILFQDGYYEDEVLKKIIALSLKICEKNNIFILNKIEN